MGVVGAGALGFHHIRLLKQIEGADLVGFYDHNPTRSAKVAKELETVAFSSPEALLDRVEAVTVVVPTPAHVEVGLPVLERGLHALVEKPLARTVAECRELVDGCRAAGVLLGVNKLTRFRDTPATTHRLIREGGMWKVDADDHPDTVPDLPMI